MVYVSIESLIVVISVLAAVSAFVYAALVKRNFTQAAARLDQMQKDPAIMKELQTRYQEQSEMVQNLIKMTGTLVTFLGTLNIQHIDPVIDEAGELLHDITHLDSDEDAVSKE